MAQVSILPPEDLGENFIPDEFLPKGKDEYWLRNQQVTPTAEGWRNLQPEEIEALKKNNNSAADWNEILVTDSFLPAQIRNNQFYGLVRIGSVRNAIAEYNDLRLSLGITNSAIISCDIGDDCAIHNVRYLAHYILGPRCILFNIDEMLTGNCAKFGNGIIKDGESARDLIWLDLANEAGGRKVLPFDGMLPADAYLWAKYRDDSALQTKLIEITQNSFEKHRGVYGTVGAQSVIKNSRMIKDTRIGESCVISGANKLQNLTINSSAQEPTEIGEGVELVDGIIGFGCHIFYGCKAIRFVLGSKANLKYGARFFDSYLGDNSTIACCEALNNLIFPAHEQHHNNSFLIASLVMGQSNIAAGATIGSNHNSRANDNEVQAGRGFWPGLCASIKHSSRFTSFVLLAKGDFPAELDIPFPFSLVNNNVTQDQLEVIPAFWWLYNMYALARNTWKFKTRDKRVNKRQNIEFEALAPDTIEEIFAARQLLEIWIAKAVFRKNGSDFDETDKIELIKIGREIFRGLEKSVNELKIWGENMEKSRRKVVIAKAYQAYHAYGDMIIYYAVQNLLKIFRENPKINFNKLTKMLDGKREMNWINMGGQLVPENAVDTLRTDIGLGRLKTWTAVHARYDELWKNYPLEKQKHAFAALKAIWFTDKLTPEDWQAILEKAEQIQQFVCDQVWLTRRKDFNNPFLWATYRNEAELKATIGTIEENSFVLQVRSETEEFKALVREVKERH